MKPRPAADPDRTRICDLGLAIPGSRLEPLLAGLDHELRSAGIRLAPKFYLSNEYGCVEGTCNVGLLWVDALDPAGELGRRYRRFIHDAGIVRRVLRHEAGHAFNYVHRIHESPAFRIRFKAKGDFFRSYPDAGWEPTEAHEVRVRRGEYINIRAAKHPDEDFAICFQTWLDPEADWREDFRRYPEVIGKLRFVEEVAGKFGLAPYANDPKDLDQPIGEITRTVGEWFTSARA